jgi:hypothetical protein
LKTPLPVIMFVTLPVMTPVCVAMSLCGYRRTGSVAGAAEPDAPADGITTVGGGGSG